MRTLLCLTALTLCFSFSNPAFAATRLQAVEALNDAQDDYDTLNNDLSYAEYRIDEFQFYINQAISAGMPGPHPSVSGFESTVTAIDQEMQSATGPGGHITAGDAFLVDGDVAASNGNHAQAGYFYQLAKAEGQNAAAESQLLMTDAEELIEDILAAENAFLEAYVAWQESQQE